MPAGTGNDLARTLEVPLDPREALARLDSPRWLALDAIEAVNAAGEVLGTGVNAAVAGPPAQTNEDLDPTVKAVLGPLALLLRQPQALLSAEAKEVQLTLHGTQHAAQPILGYVLASGQTVGGGRLVAPGADPTDGCLDLLVLHDGDRSALLGAALSLLSGEVDHHPLVRRHRVQELWVDPVGVFPTNLDGDLLPDTLAGFRVRPAAVEIALGDGPVAFGAPTP